MSRIIGRNQTIDSIDVIVFVDILSSRKMGGNQETRTINFEFKSSTIPSFMPSTKSDYVPFELFFSIHVGMIYHHLYTPLDPSYSQRIHYEKAGFHLNQSSNYANLSAFCACARARAPVSRVTYGRHTRTVHAYTRAYTEASWKPNQS